MEQLAQFLVHEEYRCVAGSEAARPLVAQVWFNGTGRRSRSSGLLVHHGCLDNSLVDGMALLQPQGSSYCILPGDGADDGELAWKLQLFRPIKGFYGEKSDISRVQGFVATKALEERDFLLMVLDSGQKEEMEPLGAALLSCFLSTQELALHCGTIRQDGLLVRDADKNDFRELCRLHEEYLDEELQLHTVSSRWTLHQKVNSLLEQQHIVLAFKDGKPAGKANTNARGLAADQIGGVYVRPEFRNQGIATAMVGHLSGAIRARGRNCILYVRPENRAARRVYEKLGFSAIGVYRSVYF
ncbi:MAG: GNAT family N-acetyltransferase [Spirochaetaceae bacterium]|nr:GNAT family N-acetyltransferase [Spirochaetaceae bacterium]